MDQQGIVSLCKKPDQLAQVESTIRELRDKYLPILEQSLSPKQARLEFALYMDLVIRCLFCKNWPVYLEHMLKRVGTGRFAADKVKHLGGIWAKYLDLKHPEMNFATNSGLIVEEETNDEGKEEVNIENLGRSLKRNASETQVEDLTSKLKAGDIVTVVRRMSWVLPQDGKRDYRKDVVEGTEGEIVGWVDLDKRAVLLKVELSLPLGLQTVVYQAPPRNLQLSSEYKLAKAGASGGSGDNDCASEAASASGSGAASGRSGKPSGGVSVHPWALLDSAASQFKLEPNWTKLLANSDKLNQNFWLRSRIGVSLEALHETLPTYSCSDLAIAHRQNKQGIWKDEVWTKRPFAPQELQFAPLSSQVKDTNLTLMANALVGLPKSGPGRHPENGSLALDGRSKTSVAKAGSIDGVDHTGVLFWLVGRTSEANDANMSIEIVSFHHIVDLVLPFKKQKTTKVEWHSKDLPTIPILVNQVAIKEYTRLIVFQEVAKKENK